MVPADKIRAARLQHGLTMAQAAELIGYSTRSWEDWEYGKRNMREVIFEAFQKKAKGLKGKK